MADFVWGDNGAQLTPEQIAARRKVADAMALEAGDASPIRSAWQGVARLAKGVSAGLDYRAADRADKTNADANKEMIAALLGGGGASPVASVTSSDASVPVAAVGPAPVAADTSGKVYRNDELTPMDMPSGADRDALIRTVYGEAGNESPLGQQAVASVIRNRAIDGGYGGDTPSAVVRAPNQFEPWNGGPARDRMLALSPNDPKYQAISKVVDAAYGTDGRAPEDPTEGMTHFYSPAGQAALGRKAPAWAGGESVTIGGHVFNSPDDAVVAKPAQVAATDDPAAIPANAVPAQGYAVPGQPTATVSPAVAKVSGALAGVNPAVLAAVTSPYASESTKKIAGIMLQSQLSKEKKDTYSEQKDADGNVWSVNNATGQRTVALKSTENPTSIREYEYAKAEAEKKGKPLNMDYPTWSVQKARAGATNVTTTVGGENKGMEEAQKLDAEAVRKGQNEKMPALDDADHNFQMMQDAIERNGGKMPTGGVLGKLGLDARRTAGYIRENWGIDLGDDPTTAVSLETFNKGGIKAAGDMAKAIGGNRVLKVEFEMAQRANPGLETTDGGNKYLLDLNRNTIAIQKDHLQAQEDYWRTHNHSLDGFQKEWNTEVKANPRPLSNFGVTPPIDNGDGSQMIKLPSTAQGGYSWYQKGPNGLTVVTDRGVASKLDDATKPLKQDAVAPVEKVVDGKTYIKQDGNWFEKH